VLDDSVDDIRDLVGERQVGGEGVRVDARVGQVLREGLNRFLAPCDERRPVSGLSESSSH